MGRLLDASWLPQPLETKAAERDVARADLVDGLVRGIAVLQAFDRESPVHTASSLAKRLGFSRAAARRFLITLTHIGLAQTDEHQYWLTPKVSELAQSFDYSEALHRTVGPTLRWLADRLEETVTFSVLNGRDMLYLSSIQAPRVLTVHFPSGTRLPVHCAAAGWAILAAMPPEAREAWLRAAPLKAFTPNTLTDPALLGKELAKVKKRGFARTENLFEVGLRGIAVAVCDARGAPLGALSVSTSVAGESAANADKRCGGALLEALEQVKRLL